MVLFVLLALLVLLLALGILFRPYILKTKQNAITHQEVNSEAYRYQLDRLEADRSDGSLSQDNYLIAVRELEKRMLEDAGDAPGSSSASYEIPKKSIYAICLLIPLISTGLYMYLGEPNSLDGFEHQNQKASKEVEEMVSGLAEKLKKDPNNPKGWAMLARSYKVMGRPLDAEKAYQAAESYIENDAQLLADYADVMASNAGGNFSGKPEKLIQKALQVDPNNPIALWLSGTAAFNAGKFTEAVKTWSYLLNLLDPESEDARVLQSSIDEAKSKGGIEQTISKNSPKPQAVNGVSISGIVDVDPKTLKTASVEGYLMVIARLPDERMPIAVMRAQVSSMPTTFKLDDTMSMNQQIKLSSYKTVVLEARLSKTGQAKLASGDFYSKPITVDMGAKSVKLKISEMKE
jgi:cytochrome c-type biogenesis protein CcmH